MAIVLNYLIQISGFLLLVRISIGSCILRILVLMDEFTRSFLTIHQLLHRIQTLLLLRLQIQVVVYLQVVARLL